MRTLIVVAMLAIVMTGCSTAVPKTQKINDLDKIGYVNAQARIRGTQVYWVHPPQKRVESGQTAKSM